METLLNSDIERAKRPVFTDFTITPAKIQCWLNRDVRKQLKDPKHKVIKLHELETGLQTSSQIGVNTEVTEQFEKRQETYPKFNRVQKFKKKGFMTFLVSSFYDYVTLWTLFLLALQIIGAFVFTEFKNDFLRISYFYMFFVFVYFFIRAALKSYYQKVFADACQKENDRESGYYALRDNSRTTLTGRDQLVVGDIIFFTAHDRLEFDGIIVEADDEVDVDETQGTGDTRSMVKQPLQDELDITQADPFVYAGSKIIRGNGKIMVLQIGHQESLHQKDESKEKETKDMTKLDQNIRKLTNTFLIIGLAVASIYLFYYFRIKKERYDTLNERYVVAFFIVIFFFPVIIPLMRLISLTASTAEVKNFHAIVREPEVLESLARIDTLMLDKTGTFTFNVLRVNKISDSKYYMDSQGPLDLGEYQQQYSQEQRGLITQAILAFTYGQYDKVTADDGQIKNRLCQYDQEMKKYTDIQFKGPKEDQGLLYFLVNAQEMCQRTFLSQAESISIRDLQQSQKELRWGLNKLQRMVIDSPYKQPRLMKHQTGQPTVFDEYQDLREQGLFIRSSNIPELLAICNLDEQQKGYVLEFYESMQKQCALVIGFAFKRVQLEANAAVNWDEQDDFEFLFQIGLNDIPRTYEARDIGVYDDKRINKILVSGDTCTQTSYISKMSQLTHSDNMLFIPYQQYMDEFLGNDKDWELVKGICECTPHDKKQVIRSYQNGHNQMVAYVGDAASDIIPLKQSDVGISMARASTIECKTNSEIIIMNDNLKTLKNCFSFARNHYLTIQRFFFYYLTYSILSLVLINLVFYMANKEVYIFKYLKISLLLNIVSAVALGLDQSDYKTRTSLMKEFSIFDNKIKCQMVVQFFYQIVVVYLLNNIIPVEIKNLEVNSDLHVSLSIYTFVMIQTFGLLNARNLKRESGCPFFTDIGKSKLFFVVFFIWTFVTEIEMYFGGNIFQLKRLSGIQEMTAVLLGLGSSVIFMITQWGTSKQ